MAFCRERLAPYKRIRCIEFAVLPKTISGKIRRIELRAREAGESIAKPRGTIEFWEGDFTEEPRLLPNGDQPVPPGDVLKV